MANLPHHLENKIIPVPFSGCWLWCGDIDGNGYGRVYFGKRSRPKLAHRIVYEAARGAIPDGLELDHLCRVPGCVNPDHLDPVTHAINMARGIHATKTHCKNGHPFDINMIRRPDRPNARECRACREDRLARFMDRNPNYHTRAERRRRRG